MMAAISVAPFAHGPHGMDCPPNRRKLGIAASTRVRLRWFLFAFAHRARDEILTAGAETVIVGRAGQPGMFSATACGLSFFFLYFWGWDLAGCRGKSADRRIWSASELGARLRGRITKCAAEFSERQRAQTAICAAVF